MTAIMGGLITLEYALDGLGYGAPLPLVSGNPAPRDADIIAYVQAATPVIEQLVGPVLRRNVTQFHDGGKAAVMLSGHFDSAVSVTAVRVDGADWSAGYRVDQDRGIVYAGSWGARFPYGVRNVEVDVTVGYETVPQNLQLATRELVRWWVQAGKQSPTAGVLDLQAGSDSLQNDAYAVPRRVRQLCAPNSGGGFA
jgi:hypothetical protein